MHADEVDSTPPAHPTRHELKPTSEILAESVTAIQSLAPVYKEIGFAGFLAVSAVVIVLLTVVLAFATSAEDADKWYGGISLGEEAMFLTIAAVLAALGFWFLARYNHLKTRIQELTIEIERERNHWVHEETTAKLRLAGSGRDSGAGYVPAARADGNGPVSG